MISKHSLLRIILLLLFFQGPVSWAFQPAKPLEIKLDVLPGLQFNLARFHVKPGQQVKLTFTNTDDMDHNVLIIAPGQREKVVQAAMDLGALGIQNNYIPKIDEVLWSIPILHYNQSKTITFTAPEKPGIYPYVCTLPGHGFIMYGAMYVNHSGEMPAIAKDEHIPPTRRQTDMTENHHHSHHLMPPYFYRTYIDGASPAAIAVHLPQKLSYCWDAGNCRFRFAWKGEFVDNTAIWKGHKDAKSKILGDIFYTEKKNEIIQIDRQDVESKSVFKGYKIVDGGYPEFHYQINGENVFELIKELKEGNGLSRTFRIPDLKSTVYFNYTASQEVQYFFNDKPLDGKPLLLGPQQGKQFTVELRMIK